MYQAYSMLVLHAIPHQRLAKSRLRRLLACMAISGRTRHGYAAYKIAYSFDTQKRERLTPFPLFCYFLYNIRMEFSTHSIATPESANTASHMEA